MITIESAYVLLVIVMLLFIIVLYLLGRIDRLKQELSSSKL